MWGILPNTAGHTGDHRHCCCPVPHCRCSRVCAGHDCTQEIFVSQEGEGGGERVRGEREMKGRGGGKRGDEATVNYPKED